MFHIRKSTTQFILEAKNTHGDKYDYSKVEYTTNKDKVCIICPIHGEFWQRPADHISAAHGCPKCKYEGAKAELYGIATNDMSLKANHPLYSAWRGMIQRCYSGNIKKYPTYQGCSVCDQWLNFSAFYEWGVKNMPTAKIHYHLDKDIIIKGNKIYSPQTCCFVPREINNLTTNCKKVRGVYPVGVSISRGKFLAHVSRDSKQQCIGSFDSPEDAFAAYKSAKESYIKELAEVYFKKGKITKTTHDALMAYEVEITD